MEQEKLEERVSELFERQGFKIEREGNRFKARNGKSLDIAVFSSEEYTPEDVDSEAQDGELVFVDEGLRDVETVIENDVSVIEEQEGKEYDLPSFELIGDIAVINELASRKEDQVIEGILEHHPRVKTILLKEEGLTGEYRVGEYRKLYGNGTETVHKEHGCRFKVDPTKAYFSERYSTERKRIVDLIEDGERVLVMFAGVGPFAIMAARNTNPSEVVAIEKNPEAAELLRENIELNNLSDKVRAVEGDVTDEVENLGEFDRIVMPLPGSAQEFLDLAFEHCSVGGMIHYYRFLENENWNELEAEVQASAERTNSLYNIVDMVVCGHKSPSTDRVSLDIKKLDSTE